MALDSDPSRMFIYNLTEVHFTCVYIYVKPIELEKRLLIVQFELNRKTKITVNTCFSDSPPSPPPQTFCLVSSL